MQMLDQIHEEDLIVGRKVRGQARARRQTNRVRVLRQFVGGKIDRGHAAVAPLQLRGDIRMADSELEDILAGGARLDGKSLR